MIALLAASGCEQKKRSPRVQWRTCQLDKVSRSAQCTTIKVPIEHPTEAATGTPNNRTGEQGGASKVRRQLEIHVAVVKAVAAEARPDPLYFIAGGPGQGASRVAFSALPALGRIRRHRDIVFVDVRGTGRSGPLDCELFDYDKRLDELFADDWPADDLRKCLDKHAGTQLRAYRTAAIVDDLDLVASRLGHDKVNVYGISYGTRAALAWMQRHPARIRAAILDGVAPPQMTLFTTFARDAQDAFDRLAEDCSANAPCREAFGDVQVTFKKLLDGIPGGGKKVPITHPRTGRPDTVHVTKLGVAAAIRGLLYSADLQALIPLSIADAAAGDFTPLVTQTLTLGEGAAKTSSFGLLFTITCAEDVHRFTAADLAREASGTFLGAAIAEQMQRGCAIWSKETDETTWRNFKPMPIPTLLLSGRLDPVTPPRWGELAAKSLSVSRHVVVPGAAHGSHSTGCVPRLMGEFLERPDPADLDAKCAHESVRPPFFLRRTGPQP